MSKRRSKKKRGIRATGQSMTDPSRQIGDPNEGSLILEDLSFNATKDVARSKTKIPSMPNLTTKKELTSTSPINPGSVIETKSVSSGSPEIQISVGPSVKSTGKGLGSFRSNIGKKNRNAPFQRADIVKVKASEATVTDPDKFGEECSRNPSIEGELPPTSRGKFIPNVQIASLAVHPDYFKVPVRPWNKPPKVRNTRKGKSAKRRVTSEMLESTRNTLYTLPTVKKSSRPMHQGRGEMLSKDEINEISLQLTGESSMQKSVGVENILDFIAVYANVK